MVRGSGNHHSRGNGTRHHRTAARATAPAAVATRTAATTAARSERRSERPNHGSGSHRHTSTTRTATAAATATRTRQQREPEQRNHGSGSHRHSSTRTATATVTRTRQEREPERPNHGSGSHRHTSTRTATATATATTTRQEREPERPNHGSGNHRRDNHRRSAPAAAASRVPTRSSATSVREERVHHGSGIHDHSHHHRSHRHDRSHYHSNSVHHRHTRGRSDVDYDEDCDCSLCGCMCRLLGALLWGLYAAIVVLLCCRPLRSGTRSSPSEQETARATDLGSGQRSHHRSPPWLVPSGLFTSLLLFCVLVRNSATDNLWTIDSSASVSSVSLANPNHIEGLDNNVMEETAYGNVFGSNIWTLYAGETQRVYLPRLVKEIRVTAVSNYDDADVLDKDDGATTTTTTSEAANVKAAVFKFRTNKCPPLTGPPVKLPHDSEFDIPGASFEYDYYNLYRGSTIDVRFDQLAGGTYFYLLKGAKALEEIQKGTNTDPSHWENIAVVKRHIKPNTPSYVSDVHYVVRGSEDNDIYTLVYDNDSNTRDSSLDVETDLVLSTYDLYGYQPACDNMSSYWNSSCRIAATKNNCVILEAFSVADDNESEKTAETMGQEQRRRRDESVDPTNGGGSETGFIRLKIDTYRNWTLIGILSTIPWFLSVVVFGCWNCCFCCFGTCLCCVCCCCPSSPGSNTNNDTNNDNDNTDLEEPLLPQQGNDRIDPEEMERPPPTAPHHQTAAAAPMPPPSAPLEDDFQPPMVEAIPIGDPVAGTEETADTK